MLSLYKASQTGYAEYNPACEAFIYLLKIQCDGLIAHFNVCFSQLCLSDNTRCAAHQILCVAVHWESNDFANVVFISQQHDHSVDTRGHTGVRRGTKLESVVERTEFRLQVFFAVACDFKGFDHDIQIMVADSTGGKLHAVADDIILISQDIFRVHGVQCFKAALRHREWVVCEIHLLFVLVVFIHREVVDKTEAEGILLDQVKTFTQQKVMKEMAVEQNELLKTMAEHEAHLDQTCEQINLNQQQLSDSLTEFTKAAQIIADREEDPLQLDGIKDMLYGYMTTMQKLQQESAQNIENIQSAGIKEMLTYVSAQTEANAKEGQAVQQKMTEELQKLAKTQEDIVFLNAKIANTLSSLTGTGKIQLPSKALQQDEEKWSKVLNEKMDAWIREQKAFQERLLQLEEERSQPFWSRWGRK